MPPSKKQKVSVLPTPKAAHVVIIPPEAVRLEAVDDDDDVPELREPVESDDEEEYEMAPAPVLPKGRGRPKKAIRTPADIVSDENPGMDFSLTVVSRGQHAPPIWLNCLAEFCQAFGSRGSLSLERGGKEEHLHIQAVVTFKMEPTADNLKEMKKFLKDALGVKVGDGSKW